ncbi:MAG: hypothetical protein ACJ768_14915 [Gaiellaceae bacterium]
MAVWSRSICFVYPSARALSTDCTSSNAVVGGKEAQEARAL